MRVNFQDISTEFLKNRNELLPGGYFVEIIDFLALQPILDKIGDEDLSHNLKMFFVLGQLSKETK